MQLQQQRAHADETGDAEDVDARRRFALDVGQAQTVRGVVEERQGLFLLASVPGSVIL